MHPKTIFILGVAPFFCSFLYLYGLRELKVFESVIVKPATLLDERVAAPDAPAVAIGSSITNHIFADYPSSAINLGLDGCGPVVGLRFFLTRYSLDRLLNVTTILIGMNEHGGDGIFASGNLDHPTRGGTSQCKVPLDHLNSQYPISEFRSVDWFTYYTSTLSGHRARYQLEISRRNKFLSPLHRTLHKPLPKNKKHLQRTRVSPAPHPWSDKYLRKAIEAAQGQNLTVILVRYPLGDRTIRKERRKVTPLQEYMALLHEEYDVSTLDYLYRFTGVELKDFTFHLDHKPYLELLHADLKRDIGEIRARGPARIEYWGENRTHAPSARKDTTATSLAPSRKASDL